MWLSYEKLRSKYLQKRAKDRVSISGKFTEICLHGIVIYLSIKLSLFNSLFKNQDRPKNCFFSKATKFFNPPMAGGGGGGGWMPPQQVFPIFLRNGKSFLAN